MSLHIKVRGGTVILRPCNKRRNNVHLALASPGGRDSMEVELTTEEAIKIRDGLDQVINR